MGRNDAHVAGGQLYDLYLARSTTREGDLLTREANEPIQVVRSFILVLQLAGLQVVHLNAILQRNDDFARGDPDGADGSECCDRGAALLLILIPEDHLWCILAGFWFQEKANYLPCWRRILVCDLLRRLR